MLSILSDNGVDARPVRTAELTGSFARVKGLAASDSMPVATGDIEIAVSVTVRWAFADSAPNPSRPV